MGAFGKLRWQVQILIVALVCGAGLGGLYVWMLKPLYTEIETKTKQAADLQVQVDKNRVLEAKYAEFKKEADALQKRLDELKKVLPQDKEIEHILSQVQQSARNAGLKIQQGISKSVVDHDVYSEWPMEMQVLGTYHNLGAFFEKLREIPRIVNVGKLRLESRAGTGEDGSATSIGATYEATTFVYREPVEITPETAKQVVAKEVKEKK